MEEPLPIALDLSPTDASFNFNFNPTSTRHFKPNNQEEKGGSYSNSDSNEGLNLALNSNLDLNLGLNSNLDSKLGLKSNLNSNLDGEASLDFGVCVDPFLQLDSPLENGYLPKRENGTYVSIYIMYRERMWADTCM